MNLQIHYNLQLILLNIYSFKHFIKLIQKSFKQILLVNLINFKSMKILERLSKLYWENISTFSILLSICAIFSKPSDNY